jgi:hypothetical protein
MLLGVPTPLCLAELLVQPQGNGLAASTAIKPGQTLLQLPSYNALVVPTCGACDTGVETPAHHQQQQQQQQLSLCIAKL